MAIPYKVVGCTNPRGAEGVDYACNRAVNDDIFSTEAIVERIINKCTFSKADVVAVVTSLKEYAKAALLAGQNVVLDDFGILYTELRGKCYTQAAVGTDSFDPASYIKGVNIRFRPSTLMKTDALTRYAVRRVPSDLMP